MTRHLKLKIAKIDNIVKLREREGQRVDSGSPLSIINIDCRLSISISLKLYIKFGCHPPGGILISRIKLIMGRQLR